MSYKVAKLVRKWSNIIDMALRHNHAKIQAKQPSFDIILSRKMPSNWHFQAFFGSYSLLSQDSSYNGSNTPVDYSGFTVESGFEIYKVLTCIVICIGLPLTLMAIYALYSMVRTL